MSTKPNDGGPAFPRPASEYTEQGTLQDGNDAIKAQSGMSLRAWFAGMALQGFCAANPNARNISDEELPRVFAKACCTLADAMIAELNQ